MHRSAVYLLISLLLSTFVLLDRSGPAQEPIRTTPGLTAAWVEAKIKEIEESDKLDKELKNELLNHYKAALAHLQKETESTARAAAYKQRLENEPDETRAIRTALETASKQPQPDLLAQITDQTTAREIEQRQTQLEADLTKKRSLLTQLESDLEKLKDRPASARKALAEAKARLDALDQEAQKPPAKDAPPERIEAQRIVREAEKRATLAEIEALNQELLGHDVRVERLTAERDKLRREIQQLQAQATKLQEEGNRRRLEEADRERKRAEQARREALGKNPILQTITQKTADWSKKFEEIGQKIQSVTTQAAKARKQKEQIKKDYDSVLERIKAVGLSDLVGQMLSRRRRELPDLYEVTRSTREQQAEIGRIELDRIDVEEELGSLSDMETAVQETLATGKPPANEVERQELAQEVRQALEARKALLKRLMESQRAYLDDLFRFDQVRRELVASAEQYASYLDERLLWIRSTSVFSFRSLRDTVTALSWLTAPENWTACGQALTRLPGSRPVSLGLVGLALLVLLVLRPRLRRRAESHRARVGRVRTDRFGYTVEVLAIDLAAILPLPLALGYLAWAIGLDPSQDPFPRAVAIGAGNVAAFLAGFLFLRRFIRPRGLAQMHFRWHENTLAPIRRRWLWALVWGVMIPSAFVLAVIDAQPQEAFQNALGRLAFALFMAVLTLLVAAFLHPRRGLPAPRILKHPNGWLARLRFIWYPLAVAIPMLLAALSIAGYHYTALELGGEQLRSTLLLVFGAVLLQNLAHRWIYVVHRRLAFEKAIEERKARQTEVHAVPGTPTAVTGAEGGGAGLEAPEEPEIDLEQVSQQARHLIRFLIGTSVLLGLWLIWADVLPALNAFESVRLWSYTTPGAGGGETLGWITLNNVLLTVLILIITVIASRNLPGALELTVLQRLPIEAGGRYAITAISQYLIAGIGIVVAFNAMGIGWSKVQWLIAAISVGLGFGLQEIFANFVSGIIILFERPVRVGDVVTIGEVSGVVTRIRIRATTVRNWERKELIVPNKEFITNRLLNWTLTDAVNRIEINVGVAYGSDTERAREQLLQVARDHPLVLTDPQPVATFDLFGDSALNLVLRCFLPNLENRLEVIHQLHTRIDQAFRKAGIEIAFPQRDIHVRTVHPPFRIEGLEAKHETAAPSTAPASDATAASPAGPPGPQQGSGKPDDPLDRKPDPSGRARNDRPTRGPDSRA